MPAPRPRMTAPSRYPDQLRAIAWATRRGLSAGVHASAATPRKAVTGRPSGRSLAGAGGPITARGAGGRSCRSATPLMFTAEKKRRPCANDRGPDKDSALPDPSPGLELDRAASAPADEHRPSANVPPPAGTPGSTVRPEHARVPRPPPQFLRLPRSACTDDTISADYAARTLARASSGSPAACRATCTGVPLSSGPDLIRAGMPKSMTTPPRERT